MTEDKVREFLQQIKPLVFEMEQISWKLQDLGADEDAAMSYERHSCWNSSRIVFEVRYRGAEAIWTAIVGSMDWKAGEGSSPEEALQDAHSNILSARDELLTRLDTMTVHES